MHRLAAAEVDRSAPEREVRGWNEYLVAHLQQSLQGHHDQLRDTVAHIDVIDLNVRYLQLLAILHDGFAGAE